jgi:beta-glucanase (GH16 family)
MSKRRFAVKEWVPNRVLLSLVILVTLSFLFCLANKTFAAITVLFGDTAVETTLDSDDPGSAEAFQSTASTTGTLGSLTVYLDSASNSARLAAGIYANAGGHPGTLLSQGTSTALQAGAWNTVSIPPVSVSAGTVYWIAILGTSGTLYFRDTTNGSCYSENSAQSNLATLPASWMSGSRWSSCRLSAYGGAAPPPSLSVAPTNLTFNATQGGSDPPAAQLSVANNGGGSLGFSVSTDATWLAASPVSGIAPQTLQVSATTAGLAPNTYLGHVTVSSPGSAGSPAVVTTTLIVSAPAPPPVPTLSSLSPSSRNAGGGAFTLTVNGSNFVSGNTVLWNGSALTTTFGSSTQLTAAVPAGLITSMGTAAVTVQTAAGGTSNSLSFAINPPVPSLSALSPSSAPAGGATFTLTVSGANFVSGDTVFWNGASLATTFGSSTQLAAAVPASWIASPGSAAVTVRTGAGAASSSLSFTINPPVPTLSALSPANALAGSATFTLTVSGANFVSGDTVLWNGSALTTIFSSATQLSATVSAALIASAGSAAVSVQAPGGVTSNSISFAINAPTSQLSVSPTALSLSGTQGSSANPGPASLNVTNSGNGSLSFTASSDSLWLSVTPASGTAPQTLQISAALGTLTVGTYTGHVTVTAPGAKNSPASIPVTFTVAADVPPVISSAAASSITSSGAVISWTTDKAASTQVSYGTTTAYGNSSQLDTTLTTTHTVTLSGLTAGTLYHYKVQSADSIGTVGTSADLTFTTGGTSYFCPCSIWSSTTTPGTPSANDSQAVELGVKFTSDVSGYITGIRFYKSSQNSGTHTGTLWTSSGTRLATATFTGETSSGWQQVNLSSPVAIAANTTYVASYHTNSGFYAGDTQFFAASAVNQPPLHALANGTSGGNGVYIYGSGGAFPNATYQSTNYWVDLVFNTTQVAQTTYNVSGTISGGSGATVTLSGSASATTIADGAGNFSFSGLANGNYTVTPTKAGFTFSPSSQSATVSGANLTGIAFTATAQTFSISGAIAGGGGATVTLGGAANATTTANSSGSYTFGGLGNGTYTVTPSRSGYTFSPSSQSATINGANASGVNFTATAQTFTLSGAITPVLGGSGAKVSLSGATSASTTANSSGAYSFSGLANGSYAVTPSNTGYSFSPSAQAVTVNSANVTGVNFTASAVAPTYSISGTISPASAGAGATVTLSGAASFTTTADASGNFSFTTLFNGSYTLTPSSPTATFTPASQTVSISNANVSGISFTATATSNVIFFDDFTGTTLGTGWTSMNRHGDYSNGEVQCYVPANVSVGNSLLNIVSQVQAATCGDATHAAATWNYTSGMVQWTNFHFTYGTVEFRAKMAGGQGSWPAIWLLGGNCQTSNITSADNVGTCNWPNVGSDEIDIAEFSNYSWDHFSSVSHHLFRSTGNGSCSQNMPGGADASQGFHVYRMIWTASSITFSIDGVAANCGGDPAYTTNVANTPMFLLINNAMGGGGGCPNGGNCPDNSAYPQTMAVDYVKVTQP